MTWLTQGGRRFASNPVPTLLTCIHWTKRSSEADERSKRRSLGSESPAALRRVATHGDGWYAFEVTPGSCAQHLETISAGLDGVGATLGDRRVVATPAQECRNARSVREFESLGVDQVIAPIGALDIETLRTRALKALDWMG